MLVLKEQVEAGYQKWSWAVKEGTELSKMGGFRLLYAGIPGLGFPCMGKAALGSPDPCLPPCCPGLPQPLPGTQRGWGQGLQVFHLPGSQYPVPSRRAQLWLQGLGSEEASGGLLALRHF